MQIKDNIKNIWNIIQKNFLVPFWLGTFLVLILTNILNFKKSFTDFLFIWTFVGVICIHITNNSQEYLSKKITYFIQSLFLSILSILTIDQIFKKDLLLQYNLLYPTVAILIILTTYIIYNVKTDKEIENYSFIHNEKFKKIIISILLLCIITTFTLVKIPFWEKSFTGEHTMKYNSYVEPALHMVENKTPFFLQKKYLSNPIFNSQGIFKYFESLPLPEWGLMITYELLPNNSLEYNTRLFMHVLGVSILLILYIFLKKQFSSKQSLLIITLLVLNPIFNFISFVTVAEAILVLLTFLSLLYLEKSLKSQDFKYLFISALLCGIGIAVKQSIVLWLLPTAILLLYLREKTNQEFFKKFLLFTILSIFPTITTFTSIRFLPTHKLLGGILFVIWIIIYIIFYQNINKLVEKYFTKKLTRLVLIGSGIFTLILIFSLFFKSVRDAVFLNEFITDPNLIFDLTFYKEIIFRQIQIYNGNGIFILGILGIFLILFKKINNLFLKSFLVGNLIYFIIASKGIFFHNYYTAIITILLCISAGTVIHLISQKYKKFEKIIVIALLILLIGLNTYPQNIQRLNKEKKGFPEAANYLVEHTNPTDLYIDDSYTLSLTLKTGRATLGSLYYLLNPEIKDSVKQIGFSKTMEKFHIKYLITTETTPNYSDYIGIFSDEKEKDRSDYDRTLIIKERLDENSDNTKEDNFDIMPYNIQKKFVLEKKIGDYKFYTFSE